jgi:acetyl esterase/lipase
VKRTVVLLACVSLALAACSSDREGGSKKAPGTTVVYTPPHARTERANLRQPGELRHRTAIVLVHGGGGMAGDRDDRRVRAWQDIYANAGYVTFAVDYLVPTPQTPAPVYPQPESDVKVAVQYLRLHASELGIDPNNIVVQGFSAGARLGGQLLVAPDDPGFDGGTHWSNASDRIAGFIGFYGYYSGFQFGSDKYYGGPRNSPDPEVRARWEMADSGARAGAATGPALLFHGATDPLPVGFSTAFADDLRAAGKDAEMVVVPGATHGFDWVKGKITPDGRAAARQALDWLAVHFPDDRAVPGRARPGTLPG